MQVLLIFVNENKNKVVIRNEQPTIFSFWFDCNKLRNNGAGYVASFMHILHKKPGKLGMKYFVLTNCKHGNAVKLCKCT
jgi:hypothetical protein